MAASLSQLRQQGQQARVVTGWIGADKENKVTFVEIGQFNRRRSGPDGFSQRGSACLMAIVGAVVYMVRPVIASQQMKDKARSGVVALSAVDTFSKASSQETTR